VAGFVGIHGKAVPIPTKQIEDIQRTLVHNIPCAPYPFLREGQRVRIRGGCLDGVEGIFVTSNQDRGLIVSVELIQRSLAIRINGYNLEAV
jgi:transcription antitermination factor NusG